VPLVPICATSDGPYHHGSRPQRTFAHPAGRSIVMVDRPAHQAHLTVRWRGGKLTEIDSTPAASQPRGLRTAKIRSRLITSPLPLSILTMLSQGILNHQAQDASGERFTANQVGCLRRYRGIPRFQPSAQSTQGDVVSIRKAAQIWA